MIDAAALAPAYLAQSGMTAILHAFLCRYGDYVRFQSEIPSGQIPQKRATVIYRKAAARELLRSAAGVFAVLFSVVMTTHVIRLLGQAAGGLITPESVLSLLGFAALASLPVLLTVTLFLAVLLTFSRWYRDSEMVVWLSVGLPLRQWLGPVMRFAAPVILLIAALSFFLAPWAAGQNTEIRNKLDSRNDVSLVTPGAFNESATADRVFFVETMSEDGTEVGKVFITSRQAGQTTVIATAKGHTETTPEGDRFLVLEEGRRYDMDDKTAAFRRLDFERYGVRIDTKAATKAEVSIRSIPTQALLTENTAGARAELLWRIGVPVSAIVLAMLAVPLSFVNPRAGRAGNLVAALLLYMIYNNLMGVSQAWVAQGRLQFSIGVWLIHALMVLVLILLMLWRDGALSSVRWGRRA